MYLVIETYEREICQVIPAENREAANKKADELLESRCKAVNYLDEYREAIAAGGEGDGLALTAAGGSGAWCNHKGNWDAFPVEIPEDTGKPMLSMLLKELCRKTMDSEDSGCCDGSCGECCISSVLAMLED